MPPNPYTGMPPEWLLYGSALALGACNALLTAYWYRRLGGDAERPDPAPEPPASDGVVTCRTCGAENDASYRYCGECASRLPRVTPREGDPSWPTGRGSL